MDNGDLLANGSDPRALASALRDRLTQVRREALDAAATTLAGWQGALDGSDFAESAANLALFLALRRIDLTVEQAALARLGLSSLGRSESHVRATLDAVIAALTTLADTTPIQGTVSPLLTYSRHRIDARRDAIFGTDPKGRSTRILVTLPTEAAESADLIGNLVAAGANAVRINCAHDSPEAWGAMIAHTRAVAEAAGRRVPVLMDLAGPKVRTATVSCPEALLAREKKKKLQKLKRAGLALCAGGPRLMRGDEIVLTAGGVDDPKRVTITLSHPRLIQALRPGATVHFDDGKLGAQVIAVSEGRAELQITHARAKGARLAAEKGVNLPGVDIDIPALTEADLAALDFAVQHADIIGYSFVQTARDVRALQGAIAARLPAGGSSPAIVLKVETDLAVRNLPRLIVQASTTGPVAVMIARGDLAVEIGLERLTEIQEEILWLCEAAEVPVIWATQVLEGLAKEGHASRAEATDAARGQRAECVMLNKGPYAAEAVAFLDRVLRRMDRHQAKKTPRLAPLRAWRDPQAL
ncbi:pyruvate kinase [Maritimibacter sp. HL-12]|uniref:pyruvate kinase n=1 Tax=Maritimibacter sp. HL-12 TaxID=1162418 RepID=UPI000A0EEC83|nr:pyruvate kinase [Maritimibacter sp. HL-12]SMH56569.1 pyruvate kinase [Maritimibacter sp. HL-12]